MSADVRCPSCGSPSKFEVRPPCSLDRYDPHDWHNPMTAQEVAEASVDALAAAGLLVTPEHETGDWRRDKAICRTGRETGTCSQAHDAWGRHVSWRGSDEHDAQVAASTLREAARAVESDETAGSPSVRELVGGIDGALMVESWLRARAERVERGDAT